MANITTRIDKGSALTSTELDDNFINLNSFKAEYRDTYDVTQELGMVAGEFAFEIPTDKMYYYTGTYWKELVTTTASFNEYIYNVTVANSGDYYADYGYYAPGFYEASYQNFPSGLGSIDTNIWFQGGAIDGVAGYSNPGGSGLFIYFSNIVPTTGWNYVVISSDSSSTQFALADATYGLGDGVDDSYGSFINMRYDGIYTGSSPYTVVYDALQSTSKNLMLRFVA